MIGIDESFSQSINEEKYVQRLLQGADKCA